MMHSHSDFVTRITHFSLAPKHPVSVYIPVVPVFKFSSFALEPEIRIDEREFEIIWVDFYPESRVVSFDIREMKNGNVIGIRSFRYEVREGGVEEYFLQLQHIENWKSHVLHHANVYIEREKKNEK